MEAKEKGVRLNQQAEKYYKRLLLVSHNYLLLMKKSKKQKVAIWTLGVILVAENYLLWDYLTGLIRKVLEI